MSAPAEPETEPWRQSGDSMWRQSGDPMSVATPCPPQQPQQSMSAAPATGCQEHLNRVKGGPTHPACRTRRVCGSVRSRAGPGPRIT